MPVVEMMPAGYGQPKGMGGVVNVALVQPAPTRAVRAAGSTRTPFIADRSMTRPSLTLPSPGPLWPPPRMATTMPLSRPKLTAAMTSATSAQRAISSGRLSIMPL